MGSFVENVNKLAIDLPAGWIEEIVNSIGLINQSVNDSADNALIATTKASEASVSADIALSVVNTVAIYTVATINDLLNVPLTVTTVIVKDLDRGGTFIWSSTGTANGGTVFAGATGYWVRQYSGAVNVKWFGAKGDGVTDDSSSIQLADASGAESIVFTSGSYSASSLEMTTNWIMDDGATIYYNGPSFTNCISCIGSDLKGNINVSANGGSPLRLLNIEGNRNIFSRVVVSDVTSPASEEIIAVLRIGGSNNSINQVVGSNLRNTGNTNASSPQMITFGGSSNNNVIDNVIGNNITSGVLTASPNTNYVGEIKITDGYDNGIYCTSGDMHIKSLTYQGYDEAAVFISGANATLESLIVLEAGNTAIRILNCGDVKIGDVVLKNNNNYTLIRTSNNNIASNSLTIRTVSGEFSGDTFAYLNNGTLGHLSIGKMDVSFIYDATIIGSLGSWCRFNIAKSIAIGDCNISIIDKDNALTSESFVATFPSTLSRHSYIKSFNVSLYKSDLTTPSTAIFQGKQIIHPLMRLYSGYLQTNLGPYLRELMPDIQADKLYTNVRPTNGTWKKGQILFSAYPSIGGAYGYICVASGTPGTWGALPNVLA